MRKTQSRGARLAAIGLGLTTALSLGLAGPAAAQQQRVAVVDPTVLSGNPTCDDVPDGFVGDVNLAPKDATGIPVTSDDGTLTGTLDINLSDDGRTLERFDFHGQLVAGVVLVKGGRDTNAYDYRPNGMASDEQLVAPDSDPHINHIRFCFIPSNGS
ncbi:hypothetical protein [Streptomyces sp. NPDC046805]|uniref:hypothetical protein n=1 Tax=Streptomyces sp. NPDC046805 TaxID=3155134 RepID=UPI0033CA531F